MESKYKKIILPFLFFLLHANPTLKTGDIILRKEKNLLSDMFSQIDPCGYSHAGIIVIKDKIPYVLNIEYETTGKNLKLIKMKNFLSSTSKYIILSPNFKLDNKKLQNIINSIQKENIKFDIELSLNNKKLYCTELVDYIYYKLIHKHIYAYLYDFRNKKIITVKSLLKSKYFFKIK
ncbi:hypothetical protein NAMH_0190 [Nautilia profundicola AmH]|uniref:Peptidoglycan peptidase n=1 Tax=Nautilia profundicola (strain ATCC BAA-1463 / DSM 18972 / AmH) TaxID=598659 RepID=B9L7K7_NAUPA|nr:YiiX/YebB-like N1pC/P60 family cysteine hydrolase [Nautilia profundicola]ACM93150.1 hypothetical protein NAMH_0190 [Nautilia profundicola AmH]